MVDLVGKVLGSSHVEMIGVLVLTIKMLVSTAIVLTRVVLPWCLEP